MTCDGVSWVLKSLRGYISEDTFQGCLKQFCLLSVVTENLVRSEIDLLNGIQI